MESSAFPLRLGMDNKCPHPQWFVLQLFLLPRIFGCACFVFLCVVGVRVGSHRHDGRAHGVLRFRGKCFPPDGSHDVIKLSVGGLGCSLRQMAALFCCVCD
jgi:hypothetical protein